MISPHSIAKGERVFTKEKKQNFDSLTIVKSEPKPQLKEKGGRKKVTTPKPLENLKDRLVIVTFLFMEMVFFQTSPTPTA